MKKTISSLLIAASSIALFSCSNPNTFRIEGSCSAEIPDSIYYIYIQDEGIEISENAVPVDSVVVDPGKKFSWQTSKYSEARPIYLQAVFKGSKQRGAYVDFVMCPGETAKLSVGNGFFELDGTKFYQEWKGISDGLKAISSKVSELEAPLQEIEAKLRADINPATMLPNDTVLFAKYKEIVGQAKDLYDQFQKLPANYIAANPQEEGDIAFLIMNGYNFSDSQFSDMEQVRNGRMKRLISEAIEFNEKMQQEEAMREAAMAEASSKTAEGNMFVDFECEYEGKIQKLSDYVGKGKYILADFWASWCGPCREEIPNIINVYNKYKGSNFDVIGIAAWDDPANTLRAIGEEKIPYQQIMNSQNAGTDAYGIDGIPTIILFGPDGTILRRDIRGLEIEDAVKQALGK